MSRVVPFPGRDPDAGGLTPPSGDRPPRGGPDPQVSDGERFAEASRGGAVEARDRSPGRRVSPGARRGEPSDASQGPPHLAADLALRRAWDAAAAVPDPEVPCVTVADLGILRDVRIEGGSAVARLSPTYSGCPAVLAIELAVEAALRGAGFEARTERVLSPPWTTDWITPEGREKLRAYGIAPPEEPSGKAALFGSPEVACPRCGSRDTEELSAFGSTACKAQWRCRDCLEPFDYFKCI